LDDEELHFLWPEKQEQCGSWKHIENEMGKISVQHWFLFPEQYVCHSFVHPSGDISEDTTKKDTTPNILQ
jgi:hypothetical protein